MHTTNHKKFKGEIENYVNNRTNIFESRIDRAFSVLNFRTHLSRTNIKKKDGYHAAHLLFILTLLPLLKIDTVFFLDTDMEYAYRCGQTSRQAYRKVGILLCV